MMADGAYLLRTLAPACAAAGLVAYVLELRGHGGSLPRASRGVSWSFDDLVREDAPAALAAVRADAPGLPVVWCGHSLGGLVGLAHQATAPPSQRFDRLAAVCSAVWDLRRTRPLARRLWRAAQLELLHGLARPLGRTFLVRPIRFGTAEESLPYLAQIARFHHDGRFDGDDGTDYARALASIDRPVRLVYAEGDAWGERDDAARLAGWLGGKAEVAFEGPSSGLPYAPDHFGALPRSTRRAGAREARVVARRCTPLTAGAGAAVC